MYTKENNPTEERRKNFFFRYITNDHESIDIYIGQSSGKQLANDIANAQKEVLVVSPYIDEEKVDELFRLKNRGVNVKLGFSDLDNNKNKYKILRKLIHQNKNINYAKKKDIERKLIFFKIVYMSFLFFGISLLSYSGHKYISFGIISWLELGCSLLCLLASGIMYYNALNFKKKESYYYYDYTEKLNFKSFWNNNYKFIHSKIYIIDRKVAYIGSLNFTNAGFTTNFETRVRVTEQKCVEDLVAYVYSIFEDHEQFRKNELNYLGRQVYLEE